MDHLTNPPNAAPKVVDQYSIEIHERGGFAFVVVNVLTDDQKTESFEFAPPFAYQLSNELLRASAVAARKTAT